MNSESSSVSSDEQQVPARWPLPVRIAFRFCVLYFGAFCLVISQILLAYTGVLAQVIPANWLQWQLMAIQPLTRWFGRTVFDVDARFNAMSGSGDQAAFWVLIGFLLIAAVAGTVVWSLLDRRRPAYPRLVTWFSLFLRLCLGGQMLTYGFAKLIPTQMPSPSLDSLVSPFGTLTPMAVLWLQTGSSHPYEMILGSVEVLAGVLLFIPRTATAGALLSLFSMTQVFLLNVTFDVPVKILSAHLLMISAFLLAPQVRRIVGVLVLGRASVRESRPGLFASRRAERIAHGVQLALGVWVVIGCVVVGLDTWNTYGDGREKPPHYGIWKVAEFSVDGAARPPLTTDPVRWQRLIVDQPGVVTIQRMDGSLVGAPADVRPDRVALEQPKTNFAVVPQGPDAIRLDGTSKGKRITMTLRRQKLDDFPLRSTGFHWVQESANFG